MTIDQLIFVGLNGYALALDRDSGEIVWSNNEMKSGFVTLLLDGDRLIASTNGYMYCLDPLTGAIRWHNPLKATALAHRRPSSPCAVRPRKRSSSRPPPRQPPTWQPPGSHTPASGAALFPRRRSAVAGSAWEHNTRPLPRHSTQSVGIVRSHAEHGERGGVNLAVRVRSGGHAFAGVESIRFWKGPH